MAGEYMHIGEVAVLTNLSLRTIRWYEEVGLIVPTGRSQGGFRLYSHDDVARLRRARGMKAFFSLEEMADLLRLLDEVAGGAASDPAEVAARADRLRMYREAVVARQEALEEQVRRAQELADQLASAAETSGAATGRRQDRGPGGD